MNSDPPKLILCDPKFYNGCGTQNTFESLECKECSRKLWTKENIFGEKMYLGQTLFFERTPGGLREKGILVFINGHPNYGNTIVRYEEKAWRKEKYDTPCKVEDLTPTVEFIDTNVRGRNKRSNLSSNDSDKNSNTISNQNNNVKRKTVDKKRQRRKIKKVKNEETEDEENSESSSDEEEFSKKKSKRNPFREYIPSEKHVDDTFTIQNETTKVYPTSSSSSSFSSSSYQVDSKSPYKESRSYFSDINQSHSEYDSKGPKPAKIGLFDNFIVTSTGPEKITSTIVDDDDAKKNKLIDLNPHPVNFLFEEISLLCNISRLFTTDQKEIDDEHFPILLDDTPWNRALTLEFFDELCCDLKTTLSDQTPETLIIYNVDPFHYEHLDKIFGDHSAIVSTIRLENQQENEEVLILFKKHESYIFDPLLKSLFNIYHGLMDKKHYDFFIDQILNSGYCLLVLKNGVKSFVSKRTIVNAVLRKRSDSMKQ